MAKKYAVVSGVVFGAMAVGQIVRALAQWPAQIGSFAIPVWFSWVAALVAGSLCIWAFRASAAK